ncbi:MAG: hypothetical protein EOO38_06465 [Cytophagaceae bacterium]|nr:MAG: hypothetical protein EOO38_06465 [Cytophagaceae bacterium]
MDGSKHEIWYKKNFALALPALAFSCGYVYELGRFNLLKIPAEMIDLPLTRMIASGIALISVFLLALAGWAHLIKWLNSKNRLVRYVGGGALLYTLSLLPIMALMYGRTDVFKYWALSAPAICTLMLWGYSKGSRSNENINEGLFKESSFVAEVAWIAVATMIAAVNIFSIGYVVEGAQITRTCIKDSKRTLITEFQSNRVLIKEIKRDGALGLGVEVDRSDSKIRTVQCLTSLDRTLKIFDRAETEKKTLQPQR